MGYGYKNFVYRWFLNSTNGLVCKPEKKHTSARLQFDLNAILCTSIDSFSFI